MSDDAESNDKQFDPTPKKLEDARRKGEIAKSVDLTTAAAYFGFLVTAWIFGSASLLALGGTLSGIIQNAVSLSGAMFAGAESPLFGSILWDAVRDILPWLVVPGMFSLLCLIGQRAIVVAPSKLIPKLNRISLIGGLKNRFGRQSLFEFGKSTIKLLIYGIILGFFLAAQSDQIIATMQQSPAMITILLGHLTLQLILLVVIVTVVLGTIDFIWQSAEHTRKNRMSHKEIMDEMKQSEGDPAMKQQRRQKGMSLAMNKMLAEVPASSVIIVNPTHFSVALKWDNAQGGAPICIAKGVDEIAARIREIAGQNAIPIHSDPYTARALYAEVSVGEQIHPTHFKAVAAAIRFAQSLQEKRE